LAQALVVSLPKRYWSIASAFIPSSLTQHIISLLRTIRMLVLIQALSQRNEAVHGQLTAVRRDISLYNPCGAGNCAIEKWQRRQFRSGSCGSRESGAESDSRAKRVYLRGTD
jgi:hypothetical protein